MQHKITSNHITFSNVIQSGVEAQFLKVGMAAGDEECYNVFQGLFYRVIKTWHDFDPYTETHRSEINPDKLELTAFNKLDLDKYILSSRIRATRNITGFALPPGTNDKQRAEVEKILKSVFKKFTDSFNGAYYSLDELDDSFAYKLRKDGVLFQKLDNNTIIFHSGSARHWPTARGIFLNKEQDVACWVNEEDHCRIISWQKGSDIKGVFKKFAKLSEVLNKNLESQGHSVT